MFSTVWPIATAALLAQAVSGEAPDAPDLTLRGSPESMVEQNLVAREHDLPFYETSEEILEAARRGELDALRSGPVFEVADFVEPPFAHPAAREFVRHVAADYLETCGEKLVVTSGVRPIEDQPPNAHDLSVHPAGIAVDLRVSQNPLCREWLEARLLELEEQDLINATRERRPPHYHIAVYPSQFLNYLQEQEPPDAPLEEVELEEEGVLTTILLALGIVLLSVMLVLIWLRARRRRPPPV